MRQRVLRPCVPDYAKKLAEALDNPDKYGHLVSVVLGIAPPPRSSRLPHPNVPNGAISSAPTEEPSAERGISAAEADEQTQ